MAGAQPDAPPPRPSVVDTSREVGRCDIRCAGSLGHTLWVAERSGRIVLRDASTGEQRQQPTADLPDGVFANGFAHYAGHMWVACTDGAVRAFTPTGAAKVDLSIADLGAQSSTPNSATCLCSTEGLLVIGSESGRTFVFGRGLKAPLCFFTPRVSSSITCLAARPGMLYIATSAGSVSCVPLAELSSRVQAVADGSDPDPDTLCARLQAAVRTSKVHRVTISAMVWVPQADTLWVAAYDGRIVVLNARRSGLWEAPLATLTQHCDASACRPDAQPVSLAVAGPHVLSGGATGSVSIWRADEADFAPPAQGRVCCLPRHHRGGVKLLHPALYRTEAAVWTYGSDGALYLTNIPSAGTPACPVAGSTDAAAPLLGPHAAVQLLSPQEALHTEVQRTMALTLEVQRLQARLREAEGAASRARGTASSVLEEKLFSDEANARLLTEAEVEAGDKYTLERQVAGLRGELAAERKRLDAAHAKLKGFDGKMALAEEKGREAEVASKSLETQLKAAKGDKEKADKEIASLNSKIKMLETRVNDKSKSADSFTKQVTDAKDEVLRKDVMLKKSENEKKELEKTTQAEKSKASRLESQIALLEGQVKTLKATVLVKTDEIGELISSRDLYKTKLARAAGDLETALRVIEAEEHEKRSVADTAVLARNEAELLRRERDTLMNRSSSEHVVGVTSDSMVHRLKSQLSQLQEALGQERSNNKMLEDQYTVFQFVINSRGELVTAIWAFHDLLRRVKQDLAALDGFVRRVVSPNLRHTDRDNVSTLSADLKNSLHVLEEKSTYIVSNYFTEYEKLHFGISSYHFSPDTRRPQVAGGAILPKLQQVTPSRQYRTPTSDSLLHESHLHTHQARHTPPHGRLPSPPGRRSPSPRARP